MQMKIPLAYRLEAPSRAAIGGAVEAAVGADCEAVVSIREPDIEQWALLFGCPVDDLPGGTAVRGAQNHRVVANHPAQVGIVEVDPGERCPGRYSRPVAMSFPCRWRSGCDPVLRPRRGYRWRQTHRATGTFLPDPLWLPVRARSPPERLQERCCTPTEGERWRGTARGRWRKANLTAPAGEFFESKPSSVLPRTCSGASSPT